jgi:hypothetical protein
MPAGKFPELPAEGNAGGLVEIEGGRQIGPLRLRPFAMGIGDAFPSIEPAMEYSEHESVPDGGGHVLESEDASSGHPAGFFKAILNVLGVVQNENQQDDIEAVIVKWKPLAVEEGHGQIGFVEVLNIDGEDLAADSSLEKLGQSAIAGADVQDPIIAADK